MFKKKQKQVSDFGRQRVVRQSAGRSAVFSYHANRSARPGNVGRDTEEVQQPIKREKRKRWWQKASNLMLCALVGILAIVSLGLNANPKIVIVGDETSRIFLRPSDTYAKAAHTVFARSSANKNKITVDTAHIASELQRQFPELQEVSVSLPVIGHRPVVYLQPAMPKLVLTAQNGDSYVIDRSGRALLDARQASDQKAFDQVPTVVDKSGLAIAPGKAALDSQSVAFITEVVGQLRAKKVPISSLTLPTGGSQLDVRIDGVPYFVKFNLRGSAREEAGTYLALKDELGRQHKAPGEYIDVRVPGRAYYK